MARNRSGDDDSYFHLSPRENLEEQARIAQEMAEQILDYIDRRGRDIGSRMANNLNQHESRANHGLAAAYNRARNNSQSGQGEKISTNFIKSILNQTGKGDKFDVNWKSVGLNIGKEVAGVLTDAFATYLTKPIDQGLKDMSSAYEANFTEIAGRMGTMRQDTYATMKNAVAQLNDSQYKNAVNANKELIPALTAATQKGFKEQEAISVALTNSVDKKIMPWLDTASDDWVNIQYNLSTGMQNTLKAQQLLLQETRSGNRLLQSGVINQLTSDIAPILTNIDYNTMDTEKLGPQMQALMQYYTDSGYDPQQAYKAAQDALKAYRNPGELLQSDKASDILKGRAALFGGDITDILQAENTLVQQIGNASNHYASYVMGQTWGIDSYNGGTRVEDYRQRARAAGTYLDDPQGYIDSYMKANEGTYTSIMQKAVEKVTHTAEWDNRLQNSTTEMAYWLNKVPHGMDTLESIKGHVWNILKLIGGALVGKAVTKLAGNMLGGGGGSNPLMNMLGGGGGGASRMAGNAVAREMARGVVSQGGTAGLASGASLGTALTSVGSSLGAGTSIGGTLAGAGVVAAPLAVGGAIGAYGIKSGIDDIKSGDNKARGIASIAGGAAAAAGGIGVAGGMLAAGAANAWNPVGWGLLIAGAVTVGATAIHRAATAGTKLTKEAVETYSKTLTDAAKTEAKERKATTKEIILSLKDGNATQEDLQNARSLLVESGMITQEEAQKASTEQLKALTTSYLQACDVFNSKKAEAARDKATELAKEDAVDQDKKQIEALRAQTNGIVQEWEQWSRDNGENHSAKKIMKSYDLSNVEEGQKVMNMLTQTIASVSDDKKREKLEKEYEKLKKKGFTVNEYNKMIDLIDENATVDEINVGALLSGMENRGNVVQKGEQQTTTELQQYAQLSMELLSAFNIANGDKTIGPDSVVSIMEEMAKLDIDKNKKTAIRSEISPYLQWESLNKWLTDTKGYKGTIPNYRTGIDFVPTDRLAIIHQEEAVLNKSDAEGYRSLKSALVSLSSPKAIESLKQLGDNLGIGAVYDKVANAVEHVIDIPTRSAEIAAVFGNNPEAAPVDVTEIIEATRAQTADLNKTLQAILKALTDKPSGVNLNAVSEASPRLVAFNPATSNTRNLYST